MASEAPNHEVSNLDSLAPALLNVPPKQTGRNPKSERSINGGHTKREGSSSLEDRRKNWPYNLESYSPDL